MPNRACALGSTTGVGGTKFTRKALDKVFPDHWSFMLGEVALYCFVVLIADRHVPDVLLPCRAPNDVVYTGAYVPLHGQHDVRGVRSVVHLSFDVRAGLLIRQIHHWAALVFLGAIVVHLCRIFFTGAYRRPREINWFVGLDPAPAGDRQRLHRLLAARRPAVGHRACGSCTPCCCRSRSSGTGWRSSCSAASSRATDIISRLFVIHVLLVPALIVGLLSRAPRRRLATEAHPVPRAGPHRAQRRRLAAVADVRAAVARAVRPSSPACSPRSAGSRRSTRSGSTGRSTRRSVAPRPSPTGTWAGSKARCACSPVVRLHIFGYRVPEILCAGA